MCFESIKSSGVRRSSPLLLPFLREVIALSISTIKESTSHSSTKILSDSELIILSSTSLSVKISLSLYRFLKCS